MTHEMKDQFTGALSVLGAWCAYFMSHIDQINALVQFFVLVFGLASSFYAIRFYRRKL